MTAVEAPLGSVISILTNNAEVASDASPWVLELQVPAMPQLEPRSRSDTTEALGFPNSLIPASGDAGGENLHPKGIILWQVPSDPESLILFWSGKQNSYCFACQVSIHSAPIST